MGCERTAVRSYYVKKVVPHQLTIQRVLHQVGLGAAREYERTVVLSPLMSAACVDPDTITAGVTVVRRPDSNRLQRTLTSWSLKTLGTIVLVNHDILTITVLV